MRSRPWMLAAAVLIALCGCNKVKQLVAPEKPKPDMSSAQAATAATFAFAEDVADGNHKPPAPKPGEACPICNGTGKVGDGRVFAPCGSCGGTGKVQPPKAAAAAPTETALYRFIQSGCVPRVIYFAGPKDESLAKNLAYLERISPKVPVDESRFAQVQIVDPASRPIITELFGDPPSAVFYWSDGLTTKKTNRVEDIPDLLGVDPPKEAAPTVAPEPTPAAAQQQGQDDMPDRRRAESVKVDPIVVDFTKMTAAVELLIQGLEKLPPPAPPPAAQPAPAAAPATLADRILKVGRSRRVLVVTDPVNCILCRTNTEPELAGYLKTHKYIIGPSVTADIELVDATNEAIIPRYGATATAVVEALGLQRNGIPLYILIDNGKVVRSSSYVNRTTAADMLLGKK